MSDTVCTICGNPWFITILGNHLCQWHATQIMREVRDKAVRREAEATAALANDDESEYGEILPGTIDNGDDAA